ncbi:TetR/AcrR family transcriptional regulator [Actinocorallia aurea]
MARPRQFDEHDAVVQATDLFWRHGYHATSVRDLGAALDLTPSSLYRTFTDKHTLFLRALDYYRATESAQARALLDRIDDPVRDTLRDWLLWLVTCPAPTGDGSEASAGDPRKGCFIVNTATELGATDPDVTARTEAAFDVTRQALRDLLHAARTRGELTPATDPDTTAELLFTTVLGLRVRERAGHDPALLTTTITATLTALLPTPT